jgi:predicted membrane chloride channel (bestrophin family)
MTRDINDMSHEELITVINSLLNERKTQNTINRISVCDVTIESASESLDKCERVVNTLIEKNKKFLLMRKSKLRSEELGYFG